MYSIPPWRNNTSCYSGSNYVTVLQLSDVRSLLFVSEDFLCESLFEQKITGGCCQRLETFSYNIHSQVAVLSINYSIISPYLYSTYSNIRDRLNVSVFYWGKN